MSGMYETHNISEFLKRLSKAREVYRHGVRITKKELHEELKKFTSPMITSGTESSCGHNPLFLHINHIEEYAAHAARKAQKESQS